MYVPQLGYQTGAPHGTPQGQSQRCDPSVYTCIAGEPKNIDESILLPPLYCGD